MADKSKEMRQVGMAGVGKLPGEIRKLKDVLKLDELEDG